MSGESLQQMAGTPVEFEAGGKSYKLSPMTIGMYAKWQAWAKRQPFVELRDQLTEVADLDLGKDAKLKLTADASAASKDAAKVEAYLQSPAGILVGFGLMVRAAHPNITDEDVDKIFSGLGAKQAAKLMDAASGVDEDEAKN